MSDRVSAFAPASVSNVGCGFDVLGFAVEGAFETEPGAAEGEPAMPLGDVVHALRSGRPGVDIVAISGDDGALPRDPGRNTASVAAAAVLEACRPSLPPGALPGVDLVLDKHMPRSSGLGSSAASAVAAAVATHELAQQAGADPLDARVLTRCALAGESVASGGEHGDNVAPSLLGGFVLVRSLEGTPDVISLPVPAGLSCAVVRPHLEVSTHEARRALGEQVPLAAAVAQWGNVGALVAALFTGDLDLLGRALRDAVAEPVRSRAVPGFYDAMSAARAAGALGGSLSGSGPSLFALAPDRESASRAATAMAEALAVFGVGCDRLVSAVGGPGARRVSSETEPRR